MVESETIVRSFRFRLGTVLMLRYGLAALTAWAVLWGTTVLALRAGFGLHGNHLLWGLAGFPLMLIPAAFLTRRRMPAPSTVRALIDHQGRAGGMIMADAEVPLGGWRLPAAHAPEIRWESGKTWIQFLAASSYVLIGFLVPQASFQQLPASTFHVEREVEQIAKQIEVLKENAVLEEKRAQELQEKLNQVKEEAKAREPAKTLEAIDHLQDVTKQEAAQAAEKAAQQAERLQKTKTLADALAKAGDSLDPKVLSLSMKELNSMVEQADKENKLSRELDEETKNACKECKLTKEQLEELAKALEANKAEIAELLEKLKDAKLISAEMLKECKACQGGAGDKEAAEALAKYLKENGAEGLAQAVARCTSNKPGRGGLNRGRGDAALTFGNESNKDGVKFKEQILPPASLAALKDSRLNGLSQATPKVDPGGPSTGGTLAGAATGGGSANTQVILPRHRDSVQRYFERNGKSSK